MNVIVRWAVGSVLVCLLAGSVLAQDGEDRRGPPEPAERRKALLEGTHVFRRILFDHECKPLEDFESLTDDPARSILIVLGDLDRVNDIPGGLQNFVKNGGAVLLASDRAIRTRTARQSVLAVSGVSINGDTSVVSYTLGSTYKGLPYCPILLSWPRSPISLLIENGVVLRVATNVPSHLRLPGGFPGNVGLIAVLPFGALYDLGNNQLARPEVNPLPFLVGGDVGKGRVIVAADHSIFINEMMLPEDTNNVEFSYNCVRWLRGDTPRDRVLFLDEQGIQTKFEIPLKSAQIPFDEMVDIVFARRNELLKLAENELVRQQRNNTFNAAIGRFLDNMDYPPGRLFTWVVVVLTLALMMYMLYRLGIRARFAHDTRTPPLAHAISGNLPTGPLIDQRTRALLRTGVLNEPAALIVRRWLIGQGLTIPDQNSTGEPPMIVPGGRWASRKLRKRLRRVWNIASGRSREKIGPADLWKLQRELETLTAARQRGEWRPDAKERGGAA